MTSDETLLREYADRRSAEAFASLAHRHAGMVFGTCVRILGNTADAEDVAQECFLELARRAASVTTSVAGYLHATATRRALNALRDAATRRRHESERPPRADGEATWADIQPLVDQAIAELPEDLREPLVLHFLEGVPQQALAERFAVHQSTVSRRIERGLELLRENLRKQGIAAGSAVLATWLSANATTAATHTLTAALGRMAASGIGGEPVAELSRAASLGSILAAVVLVGVVAIAAVLMYQRAGGASATPTSTGTVPATNPGANMSQASTAQARTAGPLDLAPEGFGFVRSGEPTRPFKYGNPDGSEGTFQAAPGDYHVPAGLIRQHGLKQDDWVEFTWRGKTRPGERFASVETVVRATPLDSRILLKPLPPAVPGRTSAGQLIVSLEQAAWLLGRPASRDELMGLSAAAFRFQSFISEWCPSSPDLRMGFDHAPLAVQAIGCSSTTSQTFGKPADDPRVIEAVVASIRGGYPVIAQSLEGHGHYNLILGYRTADRRFIYLDCLDETQTPRVADQWPWQVILLQSLDAVPSRLERLRQALLAANELAYTKQTDWNGRSQASGFVAFDLVVARLNDDALYAKADAETLSYWAEGAYHTCNGLLIARSSAVRFLRAAATWEEVPRAMGKHLLAAAVIYERVADNAHVVLSRGPDWPHWKGTWTNEMRHAQARSLAEVVPMEKQAVAELEAALDAKD